MPWPDGSGGKSAAVAGPTGGGKTFIFEAAACALDLPVLVRKNIRSQWFGQTDVVLEQLRRVLEALVKVVIFVDEADTQFGGVGPETHDTERRLTGKIQQMMSDPRLRGRVIWLLMTARIHSRLKALAKEGPLKFQQIADIVHDTLPPPIQAPRRHQTLQALINCTRRSLLPEPDVTENERQAWHLEAGRLEAQGVR